MKFNNNEEAVSPVIGVILMVAITVILAAVIAVFVFGMADDIDSGKTVAATAKVSGGYVIITYQGGQSANQVDNLSAKLYKTDNSVIGGEGNTSTVIIDKEVGSTVSMKKGDADRVVVTVKFDDGTTNVILDKLL